MWMLICNWEEGRFVWTADFVILLFTEVQVYRGAKTRLRTQPWVQVSSTHVTISPNSFPLVHPGFPEYCKLTRVYQYVCGEEVGTGGGREGMVVPQGKETVSCTLCNAGQCKSLCFGLPLKYVYLAKQSTPERRAISLLPWSTEKTLQKFDPWSKNSWFLGYTTLCKVALGQGSE